MNASLRIVRILAAAAIPFVITAAPNPAKTRAVAAYAGLPLSFERNMGQGDPAAQFLWHGNGSSLMLTRSGAVLRVSGNTLRMQLTGAERSPVLLGIDELPGKVNYFLGNDPKLWRTNIPTYARIKYRNVYPGVDLVYYGKGKQLEHDFIVAPGADPDLIRLTFEGADSMQVDRAGDLRFRMQNAEIRLRKPVVYQETATGRRVIDAGYSLSERGQIAFQVASYDESLPLVVDPVLDFASYVGGSGAETGAAVALDAGGNVYLAGNASDLPGFPLINPLPGSTNWRGAFVAKLNPAGTALVYSTYLGEPHGRTSATGIAVDAAGNAYVTGTTASTDYPTTKGVFQPNYGGGSDIWGFYPNSDAFVTKLNSTGSAMLYSTYFGGRGNDRANAITVDATGNAFVAGLMDPNPDAAYISGDHANAFVIKINPAGSALLYTTSLGGGREDWANGIAVDSQGNAHLTGLTYSPNFPAQNAFQPRAAVGVLYRSADGGKSWEPSDVGLLSGVSGLAIDPQAPSTIYAASDRGVFKSSDGGENWKPVNTGVVNPRILSIVIDPHRSGTVYAIAGSGGLFDPPGAVYRTTNGAANWTAIPVALPDGQFVANGPVALAIDPSNPSTLYLGTNPGLLKSTDGGAHWNATGLTGYVGMLTIDPRNPSTLYAGNAGDASNDFRNRLVKSVDGGDNWSALPISPAYPQTFLIDPTDSRILYTSSVNGIVKSVDGGANWKVVHASAALLALTGGGSATVLYASTSDGIVSSANGGETWEATGFRQNVTAQSLAGDPEQPGKLYAGLASISSQAFAAKLNPAGGVLYSSYLGGSGSNEGRAVAADLQGNSYVTGWTTSTDFPGIDATRVRRDDPGEVFVVKMNAAGSQLLYSTTFGGGGSDIGQAIAVDSGGNAYVAGSTESVDFPAGNAVQATAGGPRLLQSTDAGGSWSGTSKGLTSSDLRVVAADRTSTVIYAGGNRGVSVSRDGGASWSATSLTNAVTLLAIDPSTSSTVYAAAGWNANFRYRFVHGAGIFKTTDAGQTWSAIDTGLTSLDIRALIIDPETPSTLYCATDADIFKTVDGGQHWTATGPGGGQIFAMAIDPVNPARILAIRFGESNTTVLASDDAGVTWRSFYEHSNYYDPFDGGNALIIDQRGSSTVHALIWGGVMTTNDSGAHWRSLQPDAGCTLYTLAPVPGDPSSLYAGGANYNGRSCIFKTANGGSSWVNQYEGGIGVSSLVVSQFQRGTVYAAMDPGADAFVAKVGADGAALVYSTYLGGGRDDKANGIAIDSRGTAWVAGTTFSGDFPLANALQPRFGGDIDSSFSYPGGDVFVVKLSDK